MSLKVVLITNAEDVRSALLHALASEGFQVQLSDDPYAGLMLVQETLPDTVILEVKLSMMGSVDLCYHIGQLWGMPLILLGEEDTQSNAPDGLLRGADFYMFRPIRSSELVARVNALNRRQKNAVRWVRRFLDPEERTVAAGGRRIVLTVTEFRLLAYLMLNEGRLVPSEELVEAIWPREGGSIDSLKFHVSQLRQKTGDQVSNGCIFNQRGVGYRFTRGRQTRKDCLAPGCLQEAQ